MEARSLSSLNSLAGNPPQYPVKPNEEKLDPLTLYILRVPGTRDVFLSPFKPQVKSVTAEDVASSLYYVHLRDPLEETQHSQADENSRGRSSAQPSIHRKPLPSTARPPTPEATLEDAQAPVTSSATQLDQSAAHHDSRSGLRMTGTALGRPIAPTQPADPTDVSRVPARKPLGPRPMASSPMASSPMASSPITDFNQLHISSLNSNGHSASLPPRPQAESTQGCLSTEHRPVFDPGLNESVKTGSFSLDLIRRDRSSGGQWNVARISCQGAEISQVSDGAGWKRSPSPSKQGPRPAIDIIIENSGYAKFRHIPPPKMVEAGPAAIISALAERDSGRSSDHSSNVSLPFVDFGATTGEHGHGSLFSRQVTMGYTKSWTANVKEKLQKLEVEAISVTKSGHRRGDSTTSWDSFEPKSPQAEAGFESMRARGYTFLSPWNGRCEFRTGHAGRTLRLTHALDTGSSNGSPAPDLTEISELRFNLPTTEIISAAAHARDSQLLSQFGDVLRSRARSDPYRNEYEDDDDIDRPGRFDLSLGQERAGGGRRGNRAKMGKLIITHEGLKMLDLVVAANIGVWWETWEKNF
ncbi:hypothetical protein NLU13_6682 [Sarocladium strictum]|uniref:Uncharacterized protein n=1 Tax=Sarocladium strictum TaxID=5046 RepID=A0AA39L634_SARSR|nr:hypothetical protein NLU13_9773 [Sarocladium strictum]KAK0385502.1 hypothetical protein NLU13_6682 [Sarocladium strictum]